MQDALITLALQRAGYQSLTEFAAAQGVGSAAAEMMLMPYLLGYDLWRIGPGDTYTKIAAKKGSSVESIAAANPKKDPKRLQIGQILVVPLGFPVTPMEVPMTSELMHYVLRGLEARYPMMRTHIIGTTAYGRPVEQVHLGSGSRVVYYNGSHHANEWITTSMLLQCLENYLEALTFGKELAGMDASKIYHDTTLYLTPMVNPDGVDLVCGAATEQEMAAAQAIAADYPEIPYPDGWKANLRGVDLNLNYPAHWEDAQKIKAELGVTGPAPKDYVGPEPLSENESRAMFDTTEKINPALIVAWHTQGEEIYWKFMDIEPEGAKRLGQQFALASGYSLEDTPYESGFAGYKDWFIQDFNRPGYTIEAGKGENPLPIEQLPDILADNLPIFLLGLSGGDPNFVPQPTALTSRDTGLPERQDIRRGSFRQLPGSRGMEPTWG